MVSDLRRLVGRRHKLRRRIIERSLWRRVKLSDYVPGYLPEEWQIPFGVFVLDIIHEGQDAFVVILFADLLELG